MTLLLLLCRVALVYTRSPAAVGVRHVCVLCPGVGLSTGLPLSAARGAPRRSWLKAQDDLGNRRSAVAGHWILDTTAPVAAVRRPLPKALAVVGGAASLLLTCDVLPPAAFDCVRLDVELGYEVSDSCESSSYVFLRNVSFENPLGVHNATVHVSSLLGKNVLKVG